jgi:hypothetical protein
MKRRENTHMVLVLQLWRFDFLKLLRQSRHGEKKIWGKKRDAQCKGRRGS